MPTDPTPNYIGISAEQFLDFANKDLQDATHAGKIPASVREPYGHFIQAMRAPALKPRHYVFVYDRFIVIKVDF